ncbi:MAG: OmpH family outer membrane protein, partial [Planctomycetaceae bacterium]
SEAKKFQQMQEEFRELQASKQTKAEQMKQKAQSIAQDVKEQQLDDSSDEYIEKEQELIQIDSSYKTFMQVAKRQLGRKQLEVQAQMHADLRAALERFGEANGYALILNSHELSPDNENAAEMRYVMQQTVSWHRNQEDITDAVIQYLNDQVESKSAVKPAAGSSAGKAAKATPAGGTTAAAAAGGKAAGTAGGTPAAGGRKPAEAPTRKPGR